MIETIDEARAFLERHGVVAMVRAPGVPSFVDAVAGEPVRGSWWGHPRGKRIYALAEQLDDEGEVLSSRLVDGKVTLIHRALWPSLYRVVTDAAWRRRRIAGLPAEARTLLRAVERAGAVRVDQLGDAGLAPAEIKAARRVLEERLLVHSTSEHTERGRHAAVLRAWKDWASAKVARAAATVELDEALAALVAACGGRAPALAVATGLVKESG